MTKPMLTFFICLLLLVSYGQKREAVGLFPVMVGGKCGYISETGKIVIKPQFDYAGHFSEGLAAVKISDKYGYINKTGELVIKPQFDKALPFSERLAVVEIGGKIGYIDKTGKYVWKPTK